MGEEVTRLECPADAMYLIHKALRAEAARVEELAGQLDAGEGSKGVWRAQIQEPSWVGGRERRYALPSMRRM